MLALNENPRHPHVPPDGGGGPGRRRRGHEPVCSDLPGQTIFATRPQDRASAWCGESAMRPPLLSQGASVSCRGQDAPASALGRKQSPRRRRWRMPERCTDVQRSPVVAATDRIAAGAVFARWPGAKRQVRKGRPTRCSASPVGPVFCLPRRPKTLETASYRKAAAFEYIIRRLDRRQNCAFCRSFRADARTRTEDPFITRFRPVSPPVTGSHLRSLVTPNRLDWR
jgi:hypothetical protein